MHAKNTVRFSVPGDKIRAVKGTEYPPHPWHQVPITKETLVFVCLIGGCSTIRCASHAMGCDAKSRLTLHRFRKQFEAMVLQTNWLHSSC